MRLSPASAFGHLPVGFIARRRRPRLLALRQVARSAPQCADFIAEATVGKSPLYTCRLRHRQHLSPSARSTVGSGMEWPDAGMTVDNDLELPAEQIGMSDGSANAGCTAGLRRQAGDCHCAACDVQPRKAGSSEPANDEYDINDAAVCSGKPAAASDLASCTKPCNISGLEAVSEQHSSATRMGQWQSSLHALIANELGKCSRQDTTKLCDDAGEALLESETDKNDHQQQQSQSVPAGALCRRLHDHERRQLQAIEHSYTHAFAALVCRESLERARHGHGIDFFAWRARTVLSSLSLFVDSLPEFRCLPANVRSTLLRAAVPSGILLRAAQYYMPAKDCWTDENGLSFDVTHFFRAFPVSDPQLWVRYARMARNFKLLLAPTAERSSSSSDSTAVKNERVDVTSYALLQAIVALSPEQGILGAGDDEDLFASVSDAQLRYTLLLRHHLEAKYSFARAADLLPELMQRLAEYKQFAVPFREAIHTSAVFRNDPVLAKALSP